MFTVEQEEKLFRWTIVWTVFIFVFAARWHEATERNSHRRPVFEVANKSLTDSMNKLALDSIYSKVFLKLRDEHERFLTETDAKAVLPGQQNNKRKPNCGGWAHHVPRLTLKLMGIRCPPLCLILQ